MSRRERQRRRRRHRGSPLRRVMGLAAMLLACVLAVGGLAVAGWVIKVAHSAPNLSQIKPERHGAPSKLYAANGRLMGALYSPEIHYNSRRFPRALKQAT